jgi:hypothetical protein
VPRTTPRNPGADEGSIVECPGSLNAERRKSVSASFRRKPALSGRVFIPWKFRFWRAHAELLSSKCIVIQFRRGIGVEAMNADQYRRYARACLELAGVMTDIHTRITMLEVAGGWLRLAEQSDRNSRAPHSAEFKASRAS